MIKIKKITYFIIALMIALGLWLLGTTVIFGSGNTVETGATITKYDYSKTVGSGGDYSTIQDALEDLPNLIAHTVTLTIKKGTYTDTLDTSSMKTITTTPNGRIIIEAEKYLDEIGYAASGGTTYLENTSTASSWTTNEWQGCWVFIVDGTGTDNGMVEITSNDATKLYVSSWPGTQPDNTSRYMISGVKYDVSGTDPIWKLANWKARTEIKGIFFDGYDITYQVDRGALNIEDSNAVVLVENSAIWGVLGVGINVDDFYGVFKILECGIVNNCRNGGSFRGGVNIVSSNGIIHIQDTAFSDNDTAADNYSGGVFILNGGRGTFQDNFGDNNGQYGYVGFAGVSINVEGTTPSGSSGDTYFNTGKGAFSI